MITHVRSSISFKMLDNYSFNSIDHDYCTISAIDTLRLGHITYPTFCCAAAHIMKIAFGKGKVLDK